MLRLYFAEALSIRAIARSLGTSPSTVGDYLRRAKVAGLSWPVPETTQDWNGGCSPCRRRATWFVALQLGTDAETDPRLRRQQTVSEHQQRIGEYLHTFDAAGERLARFLEAEATGEYRWPGAGPRST